MEGVEEVVTGCSVALELQSGLTEGVEEVTPALGAGFNTIPYSILKVF
jgi:hypothetical protein